MAAELEDLRAKITTEAHCALAAYSRARDPSNLVATCKPCNRTKRAMSADMFRARLARLKKTA